METVRGKVYGEMFNRAVCELNPMLPPVLVEGEIRGSQMVAYAYAYIQGQRNLLYTFQVNQEKNEPVITIKPLRDHLNLLPPEARLVRRIHSSSDVVVARVGEGSAHPDLECPESPLEYIQRLRREGKLPSMEELQLKRRDPSGDREK